MQHAGVGPGGDDAVVGHALGTVVAKCVQQFGIQVVFAHVLTRSQHAGAGLHGPHVGASADGGGAAQGGQFVRVFEEAHFIEQLAQVALLGGAQHPGTGPLAHGGEPALDLRGQAVVRGKRPPDAVLVVQQGGQVRVDLGVGVGGIQPQGGGCGLGAEAVAVPNFALDVFGLAKQGGAALGGEHQGGTRLGKTGQVKKVTVVPVQVKVVAVALALGRGGDDGDAASAQLGGQLGAALGIHIQGVGSGAGHIKKIACCADRSMNSRQLNSKTF